jgi:SAM-dependent methyltransferase
VAGEYERGRAGYPQEAVAWLCGELGIKPGADVLDLAAGTGKLTRALQASGARVIAVEPLEEMRAGLVDVDVLEGTAEAIPLPAGAVDAVTVAQAFHWFDGPRALGEIHRVLRPGGRLGLVWNRGDDSARWVAELDAVVAAARPSGVPSYRDSRWRAAFETTALFTPLEEREFSHEVASDASTIRDRVASISFIAALPSGEREAVLDRIDAITRRLPARFAYPYRTYVLTCRRG